MSRARPLLGIMSCNRDIGGRDAQVVANRYVQPVLQRIDAAGLIIPAASDLDSIGQIAGLFDGLFLTGSPTNVMPSHYRAAVDPRVGPFDCGRDQVVFALIEAMIRRGKPIFGICRGFQEINVFFGGRLRCDVAHAADLNAHHRPIERETAFDDLFDHHHIVDIQPDGVLNGLFSSRRITVNSVHYQGVASVGNGLAVEAVAEDGLVEAVSAEVDGSSIIGVQWHPEWNLATNPESQRLFDHFGQLMRGSAPPPHLVPGNGSDSPFWEFRRKPALRTQAHNHSIKCEL